MNNPSPLPLVDLIRPKTFDEVIGQDHLVGKDGILLKHIKEGVPHSILIIGASGSGKTSIARLYGNAFGRKFVETKSITQVDREHILYELQTYPKGIILHLEDCSMASIKQIKPLLPFVQTGSLVLIGTCALPDSLWSQGSIAPFEEVYQVNPLNDNSIKVILERAEKVIDIPPHIDRQIILNWANRNGNILMDALKSYKLKSNLALG